MRWLSCGSFSSEWSSVPRHQTALSESQRGNRLHPWLVTPAVYRCEGCCWLGSDPRGDEPDLGVLTGTGDGIPEYTTSLVANKAFALAWVSEPLAL